MRFANTTSANESRKYIIRKLHSQHQHSQPTTANTSLGKNIANGQHLQIKSASTNFARCIRKQSAKQHIPNHTREQSIRNSKLENSQFENTILSTISLQVATPQSVNQIRKRTHRREATNHNYNLQRKRNRKSISQTQTTRRNTTPQIKSARISPQIQIPNTHLSSASAN